MILIKLLIILLLIVLILHFLGLFVNFFEDFFQFIGLKIKETNQGIDQGQKLFDQGITEKIGGVIIEGLENINSTNTTNSTDNSTDNSTYNEASSESSSYTDPGLNKNPLYMATLNAANISYLKQQVDKLSGLKQQVNTLNSQVQTNTSGISALGQQLSTAMQGVTGRDPTSTAPIPSATGLD